MFIIIEHNKSLSVLLLLRLASNYFQKPIWHKPEPKNNNFLLVSYIIYASVSRSYDLYEVMEETNHVLFVKFWYVYIMENEIFVVF